MSKVIKIKKGLNIPLEGAASDEMTDALSIKKVAIVPDDFPGYTWKVAVKPGEKVSKGSTLLYAKEDPRVCLTSPLSGEIEEVNRGERRKIMYVSVISDGESRKENYDKPVGAESVKEALLKSGLFGMLRQRPFDIVPFVDIVPRDIFVTAFDTAPLAGQMIGQEEYPMLEAGLEALSLLTPGKVYLSVKKGSGLESRIAETVEFEGPHPAGNVGTQIAAIAPVNKGETVWTLDAETAVRIGRLVNTGELDFQTRVALTGGEMKNPHIVKTIIGASLEDLLKGELKTGEGKIRVISGNVLTGVMVNAQDGYLRYPYRQITAIPEGDDADEFMGWASLNPAKYSVKKTFPTFLHGLTKPFKFDARVKGGHRAMILSGEYDKVFPMDIYPEYLIKAIMAKDIERMEQLGIYEVAPEDFALPEFVDTSKIELQKLVREGLDYLRHETL
ncbi:MAG: Na(+)-translocating NADH-quinone reductase subunit A [Muribaculaceae bacterium]|nr:Na(+)-translocating NADH-quinone reductase subunit A [Muribaculaceae bacterium]